MGGSHVGPVGFFQTCTLRRIPVLWRPTPFCCLPCRDRWSDLFASGQSFGLKTTQSSCLELIQPSVFVPLSLKEVWLSHRFLLHNCNIEISNHIQADIALFFDPSFDSMDPTPQFRVLCSVHSQCCGEIRVLYSNQHQPTTSFCLHKNESLIFLKLHESHLHLRSS